jgi:hypothetical protein
MGGKATCLSRRYARGIPAKRPKRDDLVGERDHVPLVDHGGDRVTVEAIGVGPPVAPAITMRQVAPS